MEQRLKEVELLMRLTLRLPCAAVQGPAETGRKRFEERGRGHFQDTAVQCPAARVGKDEP
jgi:hypothetical protein